MLYTVGETAKLLNLPASTLRYYDKQDCQPLYNAPELQDTLDVVEFKCLYYETAKKEGTVAVTKNMTVEDGTTGFGFQTRPNG